MLGIIRHFLEKGVQTFSKNAVLRECSVRRVLVPGNIQLIDVKKYP